MGNKKIIKLNSLQANLPDRKLCDKSRFIRPVIIPSCEEIVPVNAEGVLDGLRIN